MTTRAIACVDCSSITNFSAIGISADSGKLKGYMDHIVEGFVGTETLGVQDKILQDLRRIFIEYSVPNWDGEGALPVSKDAYHEAESFVKSLPINLNLPLPEISPDNDGEISLEWYRDNRHVFVVTVSGKNSIAYAGLFGINKTHGTEYFSDSLPLIVLTSLNRLYS
jgi:hypothetical protein